jgi:hypothetical protein
VADQPGAAHSATLTDRYEKLRQVVLDGHAEGWRHGLGVLTSRGMAAWMRACTANPTPAPAAPAPGPSPAGPAPGTRDGAVVAVLAQMTLAHAR